VELIRHLLRHGDERRALSQLLVLGANLPDDAAPQMEAAQLFFSAGDAGRALEHFRHVLRIDPGNGAALAGAGEAAFRLADYPGARRYLRAVPRPSERIQELTSLADLVVGHDPFAAKLSGQERRRRTLAGITRARARLDACLSPASPASEASRSTLRPLQAEATSLVSALARARLRHAEDALEPGVDLIARIEDAADAAGCEATDLDRALSLIGRRYASDQP
jgi:tetratricopeptide (TPR) repeat protein